MPQPFTINGFGGGGIEEALTKTPQAIAAGFTISDVELSNGVPYHNEFTGPAGFNGVQPFVLDASGRIITLGLASGSIGIGGNPGRTYTVRVNFAQPLPDDRFTLTAVEGITDDAGNALDGDMRANQPGTAAQVLPSGDGVPGVDFTGRFTVDSRPEIAVYCCSSIWVDANGNLTFDPEGEDNDFTNRDLVFNFGETTDALFVGNFPPSLGVDASGFDKLGAYGFTNGSFRFLLDLDHDGSFDPAIDTSFLSTVQINALPVAENFDGDSDNGDEVGLFDGTRWYLDLNGDRVLDEAPIVTLMRGYPIVGDFNGDGVDDLATYDAGADMFFFGNGLDGIVVDTIEYGFPGFSERPVAADMNQDGIDDIGLWVPDRNGQDPDELAEWYLWVSDRPGDFPSNIFDPFSTAPFGNDIFAQFGDIDANPLLGNFDPPVTTVASTAGDLTGDSAVDGSDIDFLFGAVANNIQHPIYDLDQSGVVNQSDVDYLVGDMLGSNYGDADLNQVVDITDFNSLVIHFAPFVDSMGWRHGDFDGDGDVDISDFGRLVRNFNPLGTVTLSSGSLAAADSSSSNAVTAGDAGSITVPIPSAVAASEPAEVSDNGGRDVDLIDSLVRSRIREADTSRNSTELAFADWG